MRRSGFLGLLLLLLLATPAFAAEWPAPIAAAIAERAKSCAEAGGKLAPPEKAIRRLDLDGDGRDDFILDDRRLACSRGAPGWCGLRRLLDRGVPVERRRRLKSVLTELGSGYSVKTSGRGHLVTFKTREGAVACRFAEGCAIPTGRRGERSC
jgi:hypothetical protein